MDQPTTTITFPFDPKIIEQLVSSGLTMQQAHDMAANILHESQKQKTFQIDEINMLPPESVDDGDIVYETRTGRMFVKDKGVFLLVSEPQTQLAGAAPVRSPIQSRNDNPFNGKGKSYGAHVSSTWGNANGKKPDFNRDYLADWADPFSP